MPAEAFSETALDTFLDQSPAESPAPAPSAEPVATTAPEPAFAARVPPPEPERPRPTLRRAVFFDVENSSRADHVAQVLARLAIDRAARVTELVAVGNWRVINHDTARLLAQQGAQLVHSAPSLGVRDWSDLRIAVSAGVWLAASRQGDVIEVVSDDQAFDAVGDVATSLGVDFRRLSYRALAGIPVEEGREEPAQESRGRRRRRGGRRGRREPASGTAAAAPAPAVAPNGGRPEGEGHTAPHDELLAVARELIAQASEGTVTIDALSNALKARGFRRPPGSPRLITRLRRIKELDVSRNGAIRLVDGVVPREPVEPGSEPAEVTEPTDPGAPAANPTQRRRRRRGGRRRRGRGGGQPAGASS